MGRNEKQTKRLRTAGVHSNAGTAKKMPGGITGKGFQPGQSGNPAGRPKSRPITDALTRIGESALPEGLRRKFGLPQGAIWFDAIAMALFVAAAKGNPAAAKEIREAIEGKAPQRLELADLNVSLSLAQSQDARTKLIEKLAPDVTAYLPVQ